MMALFAELSLSRPYQVQLKHTGSFSGFLFPNPFDT